MANKSNYSRVWASNFDSLKLDINYFTGERFVVEGESVLTYIHKMVISQPNKICISDSHSEYTYSDLWDASSSIACSLVNLEIGKGDVVGLAFTRSFEYIATVVGCWIVGAIYFPIDPEGPIIRSRSMLSQSSAKLLIVDSGIKKYSEFLEGADDLGLIKLIQYKNIVSESIQGIRKFPACTNGNDGAYIIFTSGSTGLPKGAMVSHRGLLNHLLCKVELLRMSETDVVSFTAPTVFDISVWQMFSALLVGGQVTIFDNATVRDPELFFRQIESDSVTIAQVVPSFLRVIQDSHEFNRRDGGALTSVRYFLATGEALPADLARKWISDYPKIPLVNAYGPTECSDDVSHYVITNQLNELTSMVPIGTPIRNTSLYVLNQEESGFYAAAEGEAGELWVTGDSVGLGYINDTDKTIECFFVNELDDSSEYAYRTGDLVEVKKGQLNFLGRKDRQVKIRGYRIELSEIEEVLRKNEEILDAHVMGIHAGRNRAYGLQENKVPHSKFEGHSKQALSAYVISKKTLTVEYIDRYLRQELPNYMVPNYIIFLDKMPINRNGKIDVSALPYPTSLENKNVLYQINPKTELEKKIGGIWCDVLDLDSIDVTKSFNSHGGDSLRGIQVINSIKKILQYNLTYEEFSRLKNIRCLANWIETKPQKVVDEEVNCGLTTENSFANDNLIPATPAQQGIWFLWKLEPNNPYYIFQGSVYITGSCDLNKLSESIQAVANKHKLLKSNFIYRNNGLFIEYFEGRNIEIELEKIDDFSKIEQNTIIHKYTVDCCSRIFDLESDCLLRVKCFKTSSTETICILTTHEIVMDAWSAKNLVEEIENAYSNHEMYERSKNYSPSFFEYALQQNHKPIRIESKAYWLNKLTDLPEPIELYSDRKLKFNPTYEGLSLDTMIDKEVSKKILHYCNENETTLFCFLLSAFFILLNNRSAKSDLIVGVPFANRTSGDEEKQIGYFLNMLPIRCNVSDSETFVELLEHITSLVAEGIEYSSYQFVSMVGDLNIRRTLGITPVFQVMFDMLNVPDKREIGSDIDVSFREIEKGHYKYDLNLYAYESGENIYLKLAYLTDIFDESTIDDYVGELLAIIDSALENPSANVVRMEFLQDSEQKKLNNIIIGKRSKAPELSLSESFEQIALTARDKPAILQAEKNLTFGELINFCNLIAKELIETGVLPGECIGIYIGNSPQLFAGILASLKCGLYYQVLDPSYPLSWHQRSLRHNNLNCIICDQATPNFDHKDIKIIHCSNLNYKRDSCNIDLSRNFEKGGCVIQTSGTTGDPKYVRISQRSMMGRLEVASHTCNAKAISVFACHRSASLVMHIVEMFTGLIQGCPTVILDNGIINSPRRILAILKRFKVTHLFASSVFTEILVDAHDRTNRINYLPDLEYLAAGGEELKVSTVVRVRKFMPSTNLIHTYGLSETVSTVTTFNTGNLQLDSERVPLGFASNNIELKVVNERGRQVPINGSGELYVKGEYFETGEFIRTGDLVKITKENGLEYIGRKDQQITLNGYRVSLTSLEMEIISLPYVADCCAVLNTQQLDDYLITYVQLKETELDLSIKEIEIMEYLLDTVPFYTLPQKIVVLNQLPTLPNGKLDRSKMIDMEIIEKRKVVSLTMDGTQKTIHEIWIEVLETKDVNRGDDFFDLGGTSLKAVKLIQQVNQKLNVGLSVRSLFLGISSVEKMAKEAMHQLEN